MLGIKNCPAFNITTTYTNFTYTLNITNQYIKSKTIKYTLIINSNILTHTYNPTNHKTIIIFNNNTNTTILTTSKKPKIISTHLHTNNNYNKLLTLPNTNHINPKNSIHLTITNNKIFKITITKLTHIINKTLTTNNLNHSQLN